MAKTSRAANEMQLLISLVKKVDETNAVVRSIKNVEQGSKKARTETKKLGDETEKLGKKGKQAGSRLKGLVDGLRQGVGIGSGLLVTAAALKLTQFMQKAVTVGVQWNSTIEQTQIALTTLLGDAEAAKKRIDELVDFAAFTPFELPEIIQVNRLLENMTKGALSSAEGMRLVGDAAAAAGTDLQGTAFWIGRVYAGLSTGTPVGEATLRLVELGLITGDLKIELDNLAKTAQGQEGTMAILERAFGKTSGAMELQSRTLKGLMSTLRDTLGKMAGDTFKGFFEGLKSSLESVLEQMNVLNTTTEVFVDNLKKIPENAKTAAIALQKDGGSMEEHLKKAAADAEMLAEMRRKAALISMPTTEEFRVTGSSNGQMVRTPNAAGIEDWKQFRKEVMEAFPEAFKAAQDVTYENWKAFVNGIGDVWVSQVREQKLGELKFNLPDDYDALGILKSRLEGKGILISPEEGRMLEVVKAKLEEIEKGQSGVLEKADAIRAAWKEATEKLEQQLAQTEGKIALLDAEFEKKTAHWVNEEARELARLEKETELHKLFKEREKLLKQIEKAEKDAAQEENAKRQKQIEAERAIYQLRLDSINLSREKLDADFTRTDAEKFRDYTALYVDEIGAIDDLIAKLRELQDATGDYALKQSLEGQIIDLTNQRNDTQVEQGRADPSSFGDQMKTTLTDLRNEWRTMEEMMAQGFGEGLRGSVDLLTDSLTNFIMTGKTGFKSLWNDFATSMVSQFARMVVQWAASKMAMFAIDKLMAAKSLALSLANAAKSLVAWIPSAIAASISSWGIAAAIGTAAVVGILAGFKDGGYTGNIGRDQVAGVAHGQEYVMDARTTSHFGRETFDYMRATGEFPSTASSDLQLVQASRGYIDSAGASRAVNGTGQVSSPGSANYNAMNAQAGQGQGGGGQQNIALAIKVSPDEMQLGDFLESHEGQKILINGMKENQYSITS